MALTFITENQTLKNILYLCPFFILTDNHGAVSALRKEAGPTSSFNPIVFNVRNILLSVISVKLPKVCWIPGYVPGCVTADTLAVRGSKLTPDAINSAILNVSARFNYSALRDSIITTH